MAKLEAEFSNAELFIELVRRALPNESAHAALCGVWEETSGDMLPDLTLELFAHLVSSCHVSYRPSPAATVTTLRSADPETSSRTEAILEWIRLDSERQKAHHDLHGGKYSWFKSSWLLVDYLEAAFPDDLNPGKVIADYLDEIFPDAPLEEHQHLVGANKPGIAIYHGSQVYDLIREIGRAALGNAALESRHKQCLAAVIEGFLDPRSQLLLGEGISLEDVVIAGVQAPAGLALGWLRDWLLDEDSYGFSTASLSRNALQVLLRRCVLHASWVQPGQLPLTVYLLWDLVFKLDRQQCLEIDEETEAKFIELFAQYTALRRSILCGVSPLDKMAVHDFFTFMGSQGIEYEDRDLTFLLARGQYDFAELYLQPEQHEAVLSSFAEKQELYLALFSKAVAEGLPELGNALLSLYLLGRGIFCQGRFPLGSPLCNAIESGIGLPGSRILEHTIREIIDKSEQAFARDPQAALSRRFLGQYLPKRAQLSVLQGEGQVKGQRVTAERDIELFFREQLGESRWQKLSVESRDSLVSSEIIWRKTYSEFGWGIKDFSGMVTLCCKAIEQELVDRLSRFYFSDDYGAWVAETFKKERPKEPTSGWLVQMLRGYPRFTPELQKCLDAGRISIQHDKELLDSLQKIIKARNDAAHKEQFNMAKFSEFRKLFFQDKVLERFIDALA